MNKFFLTRGGGNYTAPTIEIESFVTEGGFTVSGEFIEGLTPDEETLTWD